jgi:hypothetical protein
MVCALPGLDFKARLGRGWGQQGGSAAPGGGGRCEPYSGEAEIRPGQSAARGGATAPREEVRANT